MHVGSYVQVARVLINTWSSFTNPAVLDVGEGGCLAGALEDVVRDSITLLDIPLIDRTGRGGGSNQARKAQKGQTTKRHVG